MSYKFGVAPADPRSRVAVAAAVFVVTAGLTWAVLSLVWPQGPVVATCADARDQ